MLVCQETFPLFSRWKQMFETIAYSEISFFQEVISARQVSLRLVIFLNTCISFMIYLVNLKAFWVP